MAANVETMFYTRTKPWHGLGTMVEEAPTSGAALELAGLDWRVVQKNLVTEEGITVPGFRANLRETDNQVLGVVSDRYKVVQNEEAFAFTDELLGEGVTYETAGSLQNGRRTWILAKLPTGSVTLVQHYPKTTPVIFWSLSILISLMTERQSVRFSSRVKFS